MFLPRKIEDNLSLMSRLVQKRYTNKNGNKSIGYLWDVGRNKCKISSCGTGVSPKGTDYVWIEYKRASAKVDGRKTPVTFAPHKEYYVHFKQLFDLCGVFGHELKDKPPEMSKKAYMGHVCKRIGTFIGKELEVVVARYPDLRKDDYGFKEKKKIYSDFSIDIVDWRMKFVEEEDWNVLYNMHFNL